MKTAIRYFFLLIVSAFALPTVAQNIDSNLLTLHFKTNRYLLTENEKQKIDSFFREKPNAQIETITGHTDMVGSSSYNKKLSAKRSQQVVAYLHKLSSDIKINRTENLGETKPLDPNDFARNRRVEILFAEADKPLSEPVGIAEPVSDKTDTTIIKKLTFEKIYFVPDKAIVNMESFPYLDDLATMVKTYATEKLEIRGHVNCPEWLSSNPVYMQKMDDLSEARAKEVYRQLVARGVSADRLTYKGMGNREMVYPEARTEAEQRKNMRVEIVVRK